MRAMHASRSSGAARAESRIGPPEHDLRGLPCPLLLLLPAAALWPSSWLARAAGLALLFAWLAVWSALRGVRRRAKGFLSRLEGRP
jgi:hypothetical protein